MNILEIKNNLVKISYEANDNLALSDFVIIEDLNSPYVAQVMNIKAENANNYAVLKLLFTFNDEGILKNYNGTIPSTSAAISKLPAKELLDIIPADNPLFLGNIAQKDTPLNVDISILENNLLICSNNFSNTEKLITNIINQLGEKVLIIDPEGQFEYEEKISIGKDFKLPLNADFIDYIYENDLADVDPINKAVIQDILIEVQKYIHTLPDKFLPFDTFVNVIDSQYKESKIPELVLLKNKLLKYKESDVFAQNIKDVLSLNIILEQSETNIVDLSVVANTMQTGIIKYLYDVLNNINEKYYVFVKVNNDNITKKLLKRFIEKSNVNTTIICPHEFKYIQEVKEISQNIIFFAPLTISHDFASYNTYLNKLNNDEFVVYGAHTQNIPFIAEIAAKPANQESDEIKNIDESVEPESETNQNQEELDLLNGSEEDNDTEDIEIVEDEVLEEPQDKNEQEIEQEEKSFDNSIQPVDNIFGENDDIVVETLEETPIDSLSNNDNVAQESTSDDVIEQVAKDVDKAFYEKLPNDDEFPSSEDEKIEIIEDDLTEDDLNIIDELSSEDIPLAGEYEAEQTVPVEEEENPPVVPIYPADDIEEKDNQVFEAGDNVTTAKYGDGVVEKMVKYGNKMLCSIDFPNIGRRLLDPAMTEIKKI